MPRLFVVWSEFFGKQMNLRYVWYVMLVFKLLPAEPHLGKHLHSGLEVAVLTVLVHERDVNNDQPVS